MSTRELKKILYVEDDPHIQRIGQMALEKVGGFEVKMCSSGSQALSEVSNFMPDLILLDIMLPEMDGLEIQKKLQDNPVSSDIPVVFMTAHVQIDEVEQYRRSGALGVIFKPFDLMTLADQLRKLWNGHFTVNE